MLRHWMGAFYSSMDRTTSGAKATVNHVHSRFFVSLGIADPSKVQKLSRLLQLLHEAASQLDGHLSPVSASILVAVSRICEADNPLSHTRFGWMRGLDRLLFFLR